MLFVGITGGVGAGKSEILSFLRENYNCKVMLTDEIAHDLMEPGTVCYESLKEIFSSETDSGASSLSVYNEDGTFHRQNLAKVIFTDVSKRDALNGIVHPAVKQYVVDQYQQEREKRQLDLLVVESALLIDDHYDVICDEMWYIYTSEDNRRARLKASRGYSDEKVQSIFDSQLSEEAFRKACLEVIDNNGTTQESFRQIEWILARKGIAKKEI